MPEPEADCSELKHGEQGRPEFIITRVLAPEVFDLVEKFLNQVTVFVKYRAELVSLRAA